MDQWRTGAKDVHFYHEEEQKRGLLYRNPRQLLVPHRSRDPAFGIHSVFQSVILLAMDVVLFIGYGRCTLVTRPCTSTIRKGLDLPLDSHRYVNRPLNMKKLLTV